MEASAQTPVLYNTIGGIIWSDGGGTPNGIRDVGESLVGGVLVSLVVDRPSPIPDTTVATTISDGTGAFTLNNFIGIGSFYITYAYPTDGYNLSPARQGADLQLNSAASGISNGVGRTATFQIANTTNLVTYGLGIHRKPNTITYWAVKPATSTNWTENFVLPKADVALGTLTNVSIFATNASQHPLIRVENTSTTSGTSGDITSGGRVTFNGPDFTPLVVTTAAVQPFDLQVFDGIQDFGGASGATWAESFGGAFGSTAISTFDIGSYSGTSTETISIGATATTVVTTSGGGNIINQVTTVAAAGVFVTYTYAAAEGAQVRLTWTHAASDKAPGFAVERSSNGRDFSQIGFVASEAGRKDQTGNMAYAFTDAVPSPGRNFYRLQQTDAAGRSVVSAVRTVSFGEEGVSAAYPNPADASVAVTADAGSDVILYNALGQVMTAPATRTGNQTIINTGALQQGVYSLQVTNGGAVRTERLVIQHR